MIDRARQRAGARWPPVPIGATGIAAGDTAAGDAAAGDPALSGGNEARYALPCMFTTVTRSGFAAATAFKYERGFFINLG